MSVTYPQPPNFFLHTDRYRFNGIATGGDPLQSRQIRRPSVIRVVGGGVAKWAFRSDRHTDRRLTTLAFGCGECSRRTATELAAIEGPDKERRIQSEYRTCVRNSTPEGRFKIWKSQFYRNFDPILYGEGSNSGTLNLAT